MERVALENAEHMMITGCQVDDVLFTRLQAQFEEAQSSS
tara:strand:+ start:926 stop:1042 length:117 start_codon:yes stop_codon:yes gene_type:complete